MTLDDEIVDRDPRLRPLLDQFVRALRRIALGGLALEPLTPSEHARARLPREAVALRVARVGQHAPDDAGRRAGFQKGDVLLSCGGRADFSRETA
jgi:hypothetical protein